MIEDVARAVVGFLKFSLYAIPAMVIMVVGLTIALVVALT